MAKDHNHPQHENKAPEPVAVESTQAPVAEAPAVAAAPVEVPEHLKSLKADAPAKAVRGEGGKIILRNGENRIDYIKRRFAAGATRSQITKEVSDLSGDKIPYQIIFAATKKPKAETVATPAAVPTPEATAA